MEFGEFFKLMHIKGYNERDKSIFTMNFLKGSIDNPKIIEFGDSAIKGYLGGNSIKTVSVAMKEAGFNKDLCIKYIESLYDNKHNGSKTYKSRYGDKTYKEALYDKIKDKIASCDEMSRYLASEFEKLLEESLPKKTVETKADYQSDIENVTLSAEQIIESYRFKEEEKSAIDIINKKLIENIDKLFSFDNRMKYYDSIINDLNSERTNEEKEWASNKSEECDKEIESIKNELFHLFSQILSLIHNKCCMKEIYDKIYEEAEKIRKYNSIIDGKDELLKEIKKNHKELMEKTESNLI